jgi:hypothetical protein
LTGQQLIGVGGPADREKRQKRDDSQGLHGPMIVFDYGQKRQRSVRFLDEHRNNYGRDGMR